MGNLDFLGEVPPPARQEVVSPSQSAFGLRAYEDEGEDGEGEAPPEVEEDNFDDEREDAEDDWDTVSIFLGSALNVRCFRSLDACQSGSRRDRVLFCCCCASQLQFGSANL